MQLDPNSFLRTNLTQIEAYRVSSEEQKKVARDKAGFIVDKLIRKKFRRRISEEIRKDVARKVIMSIREDRAIHLVLPMGAYKHFRNPSYPETDWAELFHLRWMVEYILPILAVHEPGVILEYVSMDLIVSRMNNYPEKSLDLYSKTFQKVLDWFSSYIPSNMELRSFRTRDRVDRAGIIRKIESILPERRAAFDKLSASEQEHELHRSTRSILWSGEQDLTNLTDAQKRDRVIESRLVELAYDELELEPENLGDYYSRDNHIDMWFSAGLSQDNPDGCLTIAGSEGSIVDFWIGHGVLQRHNDSLHGTIISQQQYADAKGSFQVVPITPELLPLQNYKTIEILPI